MTGPVRARLLLLLAAGLMAVPAFGHAQGAGGPIPAFDGIPTQVTLHELTATHTGPSLVIDNQDPDTVYLVAMDVQEERCRAYASTDRGDNWEERSGPDPAPLLCQSGELAPRWGAQTDLDQGPDGTLYFAYHASLDEQRNGRSALLSRSADGAQSWETTFIREAATTPPDGLPELNIQPRIALDPGDPDRIYAAWTQTRAFPPPGSDLARADFRPFVAVSEDGGQSFGEARPAAEDLHLSFESAALAVTADAVHLLATTQAPQAEEGEEPLPARVLNLRSSDGGQTFEQHEIATAPGVGAPSMVADPDTGTLHATWISNAEGNVNVYYARSGDGAEWSDPVRLNTDSPDNVRGHYHPNISVAPNGRVDVTWYDYRHDPSPANTLPEDGDSIPIYRNFTDWASLYAIHSGDGGRTWSDDYPVTGDTLIDRTIGVWSPDFFVLAPPGLVSADDFVLFAWADTRNGNAVTSAQHIFTQRMTFAAPAAAASDAGIGAAEVIALAIGLAAGAGGALLLAVRRLRGRAVAHSG